MVSPAVGDAALQESHGLMLLDYILVCALVGTLIWVSVNRSNAGRED